MRKKRSDRNHIIYKLTNTVTNETYIGVTVVTGRAYLKSLRSRWIRHIYKAKIGMAEYPISISIRTHGEESFTREIITLVRGKKNAFQTEAQLINEIKPTLNTRMQH
tara:strand:+ start:155 stop:475 length:321 start_codon:yes stop_codon:yes gene_type:complete